MNFLKLADGHLYLNLAQVASISVSDAKDANSLVMVSLADGRTHTLADKDARLMMKAIAPQLDKLAKIADAMPDIHRPVKFKTKP